MGRILTIAQLTFLEARRRKIVPAVLGCGGLFLLVYGIALHFVAARLAADGAPLLQRQAVLQIITLAGLYVANFLTIAVAVLLPVDTLSGEIASGVMQTLASKPLNRAEIVLGKWLAFLGMSAAYFAFTAGGVLLILRVIAGHVQPHMAVALPLLLLGSALMLSISMAGGARLSTVSNAIIAFAFYGIAFIGGWIEQIGTMTAAASARNIGTMISLVSPIDALWRRAAVEMSPGLTGLQFSPFGASNVPSNAMIVWAVGFTALAVALAVGSFRRRPL
ncbi:MAG TPA: ABC transporter permease [Gammaproteobacteria bacterium]|nr:ABC transporter permease [Gammaproteobacteria bacterium]